jgi:hypothetical protein
MGDVGHAIPRTISRTNVLSEEKEIMERDELRKIKNVREDLLFSSQSAWPFRRRLANGVKRHQET